jgi:GDP-D-mannose dehydratase
MRDEDALVAVVITGRPLCVYCIADKSGVALAEIEPLLTRISKTIALTRIVDRCRVCGRTDRVYSAFRSD